MEHLSYPNETAEYREARNALLQAEIKHFWGSALTWAPSEPNQHHRSGDSTNALWGLLDMTPEGRGNFSPELRYERP